MRKPLPWLGSKRRLAKTIIALIPEHRCYVEPFCGSAAVLFAKQPSHVEVINDQDDELVNFYRVVKYHWEAFLTEMQYAVHSRVIFRHDQESQLAHLTDIQRAARFYRMLKASFGSRMRSSTFGYSTSTPPRLNPKTIAADVEAAAARLQRLTIEHLDWTECIARYDSPTTFFYLDPPYFGTQSYGVSFGIEQYRALAEAMQGMEGKALITLGSHKRALAPFDGRGFKRRSATVKYTVGGKGKFTDKKEYLVRNYG